MTPSSLPAFNKRTFFASAHSHYASNQSAEDSDGDGTDHNPFAQFELRRAIQLRWALRDIKADRLTLLPVEDDDIHALVDLGLVEWQDEKPVLTDAGYSVVS